MELVEHHRHLGPRTPQVVEDDDELVSPDARRHRIGAAQAIGAVKLVLPDASLTLQALRRLVQEAKVISRLYHPNIVEVREFQQDSDGTYLLVKIGRAHV